MLTSRSAAAGVGGRSQSMPLAARRCTPASSSVGHARQEMTVKQGLEGTKAKEIIAAIKAQNFKVQSALQEAQIRVTGKKRDDLQAVIAFLRGKDFGVALMFKNFRD